MLLAKVGLFLPANLLTSALSPSVTAFCVLPSSFASGEEVECWGSLLFQMQGKKAQWLKWEGVLLAPEGRPAQGDMGKSGLRQ